MTDEEAVRDQPRFSLISAVYNVSAYLEDFIASIDAQTLPAERFEVIMVDDGSTDDSLSRLHAWQRRRPDLVRVLTKENGGQSAARNLGLDAARGQWVTFPDPDDVLDPAYLVRVDRFLTENPRTVLAGTYRVMMDDATGRLSEHPLDRQFDERDKLRDLDRAADRFFGSAPCAFFRRSRLDELGLRFDPLIRPNFEDGHFCVIYLLGVRRFVGFVTSARYLYRKRSEGTSTLQRSLLHAGRYTTVMQRGYLDALRRYADVEGCVPAWLQSYLLYELSWYYSAEDAPAGAATAARGEVADRFHALMSELVTLLDDSVIESFRVRRLKPAWREVLLHGYDPDPWHTPFVVVSRLDQQQQLVRLSYRFTHRQPSERLVVNGAEVAAVHGKVRSIRYQDRVLLHERIAWLPAGSISVELDGRPVDVRTDEPEPPVHVLRPAALRRGLGLEPELLPPAPPRPSWRERAAVRLASAPGVRRRFADAWVLMDRLHDADDSAERLFRYLHDERREINAWFVIEAGTPDAQRLRADGYGARVVAHGSPTWRLLMARCRHLISTHADRPVMDPPELGLSGPPPWRFTFLQHGVIKDDLSSWLNPKRIDLFVTSTTAEQASIVADGSSYVYTTKEAKLTGLPRFDRLLEKGQQVSPPQRNLLLVAPTWRNWLVPPLRKGSQRRELQLDPFLASQFAQQWLAFLRSPRLAELAAAHGLTVGFLPHPNLQGVLSSLDLPAHVQPLSFAGTDVQDLFARSRVLVTDYSSMAFNAAYIDRPTVYFQFDAEQMLGGGHVGRQGYFDYERDGFGPVARDLDGALAAVEQSVTYGPAPAEPYASRIDATFPRRDGRCCERVTDEILRSTEPAGARATKRGQGGQGGLTAPAARRAVKRVLGRVRRRLVALRG